MTECNGLPLLFSSVGHKKIVADFDGGELTSDGGLPLLREVDRKIGLIDAINAAIYDPRFQPLVVHDQRTILAQRILAIAAGYEDLNDHQTLRNDTLLQTLTDRTLKAGQKPQDPLSSPPTLCRLENRIKQADLVRMSKVLVEMFIASHRTPPKELVLDFDATDDPVHGNQEGRFFHGYYDEYCFLPLYVTCGQQLLVAYLRPANIDAALHSRAILRLLVTRFRQVWPNARIILRADSGFCRWRMMRWCDRQGVDYILGLAKNAVLKRLSRRSMITARWQYRLNGDKQRLFEEFHYAAATWDRPRRVIAKAEHGDQGENPRFVVTSLAGDPQALYDDLYCQRGDAENRIKEQQLGLFADRTSCHAFLANQFRVLLSAAAYVLVETLRRVGLVGTELAHAQTGTIRLKLLKIGGRIVRSVRRIVIHLASGFPLQELFSTILHRLKEWRCATDLVT
ncbi:MAG: IS1380 family transposase [Planctomycetes bacterium]|nr:IS1380 family transposase [Planctomycetota bacterium]